MQQVANISCSEAALLLHKQEYLHISTSSLGGIITTSGVSGGTITGIGVSWGNNHSYQDERGGIITTTEGSGGNKNRYWG